MTRKQKWIIGLIMAAVLIPLVAFASFKGNLIKWGIESDGSNITLIDGDLRVQGGNIGITADKDLIGLASGAVTINGTSTTTGNNTVGGNQVLTGNNATSGTHTNTGAAYLRSTLDVTSTATLGILGEHKVRVLNFANDVTLTTAMSGAIITNLDSTSTTTFTLPTAAANLTYTILDVEATADYDVEIQAASGDKINQGTAAKEYECKTDSAGQSVTIIAIDAERWEVIAELGTWSNDNS